MAAGCSDVVALWSRQNLSIGVLEMTSIVRLGLSFRFPVGRLVQILATRA